MGNNKKIIILIVLIIVIICITMVSYYIYYQNRELTYTGTEEINSYMENSMKEEAQEMLDKITESSKNYLVDANISFEYLGGKYNIEEDTNIIEYYILYNNKKTMSSLSFETVDSNNITKITFTDNRGYTDLEGEEFASLFLTDKDTYNYLASCMILCLLDNIDEQFLNIDAVNFLEELYENEQINKYGYDISVKVYSENLIKFTFEKVNFSMK